MPVRKIRSKLDTVNKLISHHKVRKGYFTKKSGKRLVIVMYHGIDLKEETRFNQRFFSKGNFEQQISAFRKHFHILSHQDLMDNNLSDSKLNVVITFDDGYLNNLTYAVPVLEKYDAHAYFFITGVGSLSPDILWADAIDIVSKYAQQGSTLELKGIQFELDGVEFVNKDTLQNVKTFVKQSNVAGYAEKEHIVNQLLSLYDFRKEKELNDYWQLMNDEQIKMMSGSKCVTIGSHGFYHNNLGSLSNTDAVQEVLRSKKYLEGIIQKEVSTIGFPDGSYTTDLNDTLLQEGFTVQFLVDHHYADKGARGYVYDRLGLYPYMGNTHQLLHRIIN